MIGSAALGALITVTAKSEPGLVLGISVFTGTLAATLAVQPRAVYRIIPVPALAYLGAAVLAGLIHDRASDTSGVAVTIGSTQWIASGFVAMTAATILAILMTTARTLRRRDRSATRAAGGGALRGIGPSCLERGDTDRAEHVEYL